MIIMIFWTGKRIIALQYAVFQLSHEVRDEYLTYESDIRIDCLAIFQKMSV